MDNNNDSTSELISPASSTIDDTFGDSETLITVFPIVSAAFSKEVEDIFKINEEDESLRRYKEQLLGAAAYGDLGTVVSFIH